MTGLAYNTTYYVRAYSTNANGTSYGSQVSLTTTDIPVTSTSSVTNVTTSSAIINSTSNSNSGSPITGRGVVYGTSTNPTISGAHTTDGSGDGSFQSSLTGLIGSTLYYVRSYVANSSFIIYGNELTFRVLIIYQM